ncbi:MAG: hypothetical protein Q4F84_08470, partial [Fibrobacter sp.]|nr:hypothetical protein [Fibrobacter sp.]
MNISLLFAKTMSCFDQNVNPILKTLAFVFLISVSVIQAQVSDTSYGWANYDNTTHIGPVTGGGTAGIVEVTTFADLKTASESSEAKVIHIMNDVGNGYKGTTGDVLFLKSNKTIIGAKPGITVKCSFQISKANNIIVRNIIVRGPGNSNSEQNWDAVNIVGSSRIWFDHCTIMDGEDGNFDVVKGSDNVTASWCKFTYTSNGEHNFSNLIGSSDEETVSHNKLNVTYAYCWWENVNSRCPRTRYGKIHVLNCYYNNVKTAASSGYMSNIRVEGSFFESNVSKPISTTSPGGKSGIFTIDCNVNTNIREGYDSPFTPPYPYKKYDISEVKALITNKTNGAGATLENPFSSDAIYKLSVSVAGGEGQTDPSSGSFIKDANITITAIPDEGYMFDHWSGDLTGNTNPATVKFTSDKNITVHFTEDTRPFYSVSCTSTPGGSITQTPKGEKLAEGTVVTITAAPAKGWKFSEWTGSQTGNDLTCTTAPVSSDIAVNAVFLPIDNSIYEAEYAAILNKAAQETKNTGFSGESYINFDNETGSSATVLVYIKDPGEKAVSFLYANGTDTRTMSIAVNDSIQIQSLDFESTSDWTSWKPKEVRLTFTKGYNTITMVSTDNQGGPNIDQIMIDTRSNTIVPKCKKRHNGFRINIDGKNLSILSPVSGMVHLRIFSL